ncbi:haloacid dehalogenase type II [candidate division KSB1 bacterium]
MLEFNSFEICSFDCYGTLIDWETGILNSLRSVFERRDIIVADSELLQLYGKTESKIQKEAYKPYRDVLISLAEEIACIYKISLSGPERTSVVDSIKNWNPFPDTVAALKKLKSRYKLAVISNIDDDLFAYSAEKLEIEFDHVITAQQTKSYKPSHKNFEEALKRFNVDKSKWLHIAQSIYHDIVPANEMGIASVWVNRKSASAGQGATPRAEAVPDIEVKDLDMLVRMIER